MYLIELILKKLTQKNEMPSKKVFLNNIEENYEKCEHLFMPIDSTNEILSCSKCGFLVKKSALKSKNFFEQKPDAFT